MQTIDCSSDSSLRHFFQGELSHRVTSTLVMLQEHLGCTQHTIVEDLDIKGPSWTLNSRLMGHHYPVVQIYYYPDLEVQTDFFNQDQAFRYNVGEALTITVLSKSYGFSNALLLATARALHEKTTLAVMMAIQLVHDGDILVPPNTVFLSGYSYRGGGYETFGSRTDRGIGLGFPEGEARE